MTSASVVAVWTLATGEHGPISKQKRCWHIQELMNVYKRKNLRVGPAGFYLCKGLVDTPPPPPPHKVPVELLPLLVFSLVSLLSEHRRASCRPSCKWRSRSSTPAIARRTCLDLWYDGNEDNSLSQHCKCARSKRILHSCIIKESTLPTAILDNTPVSPGDLTRMEFI